MTTLHISEASNADLPELHELFTQSCDLDQLSLALLEEKLFHNPCPDTDTYRTLTARVGNRCVGFMQQVTRLSERRGWLGLFCVHPRHRRQGIARRLLHGCIQTWPGDAIDRIDVMTVGANYLVAGIDPRYTPACCFLEEMGFTRGREAANMRARLDGAFETRSEEDQLLRKGVEIRRARPGDEPLLDAFFAGQFGPAWRTEALLAFHQAPPALHLALGEGQIIGFGAHSAMNREWGNFGPIGTAEPARRLGVGKILLYRCMADLKQAGHRTAVIPAIGPYRFYSRTLNCRIERVFWQYHLQQNSTPA